MYILKAVSRFGWDCHGLPVEYEIDKKLGIKASKSQQTNVKDPKSHEEFFPEGQVISFGVFHLGQAPRDVLKLGIDKYNEECRGIVGCLEPNLSE